MTTTIVPPPNYAVKQAAPTRATQLAIFPTDQIQSRKSPASNFVHCWLHCAEPLANRGVHFAYVHNDSLFLDLGTSYEHLGAWDEIKRCWDQPSEALWHGNRSEWWVDVSLSTWPRLIDFLRRWQVVMTPVVVAWLIGEAERLNEAYVAAEGARLREALA